MLPGGWLSFHCNLVCKFHLLGRETTILLIEYQIMYAGRFCCIHKKQVTDVCKIN